MKIFFPNKLAQAVIAVEEAHPISRIPKTVLSSEQLEALVLLIDSTSLDKLSLLAITLSKREIYALSFYIGTNQYNVDTKKIAAVIKQRMNPVCYGILLNVWQDEPESFEAINLLGSKEAADNRPENCTVAQQLLTQCSISNNPALTLAEVVDQVGIGSNFAQRYDSRGLKPNTALSKQCLFYYLANASLVQFQNEGDTAISNALEALTKAQKFTVIKRLLFVAKNDRTKLIALRKTFDVSKVALGTPEALRFNREFESVIDTYKWWYNYYILTKSLSGDKRRIAFWQDYLTDCVFEEEKKHAMMIMRFSNYIAIEFCIIGPMYLYDVEYFDAVVKPKMKQYTTSPLKSWMLHDSRFSEREAHHGMWENKFAAILRYRGIRSR